jgi:hypothetical protein
LGLGNGFGRLAGCHHQQAAYGQKVDAFHFFLLKLKGPLCQNIAKVVLIAFRLYKWHDAQLVGLSDFFQFFIPKIHPNPYFCIRFSAMFKQDP